MASSCTLGSLMRPPRWIACQHVTQQDDTDMTMWILNGDDKEFEHKANEKLIKRFI